MVFGIITSKTRRKYKADYTKAYDYALTRERRQREATKVACVEEIKEITQKSKGSGSMHVNASIPISSYGNMIHNTGDEHYWCDRKNVKKFLSDGHQKLSRKYHA